MSGAPPQLPQEVGPLTCANPVPPALDASSSHPAPHPDKSVTEDAQDHDPSPPYSVAGGSDIAASVNTDHVGAVRPSGSRLSLVPSTIGDDDVSFAMSDDVGGVKGTRNVHPLTRASVAGHGTHGSDVGSHASSHITPAQPAQSHTLGHTSTPTPSDPGFRDPSHAGRPPVRKKKASKVKLGYGRGPSGDEDGEAAGSLGLSGGLAGFGGVRGRSMSSLTSATAEFGG